MLTPETIDSIKKCVKNSNDWICLNRFRINLVNILHGNRPSARVSVTHLKESVGRSSREFDIKKREEIESQLNPPDEVLHKISESVIRDIIAAIDTRIHEISLKRKENCVRKVRNPEAREGVYTLALGLIHDDIPATARNLANCFHLLAQSGLVGKAAIPDLLKLLDTVMESLEARDLSLIIHGLGKFGGYPTVLHQLTERLLKKQSPLAPPDARSYSEAAMGLSWSKTGQEFIEPLVRKSLSFRNIDRRTLSCLLRILCDFKISGEIAKNVLERLAEHPIPPNGLYLHEERHYIRRLGLKIPPQFAD